MYIIICMYVDVVCTMFVQVCMDSERGCWESRQLINKMLPTIHRVELDAAAN